MATAALGSALRQIHRLFAVGTLSALPDEQLLARFAAARDEASFEALVARHGPLVLAVCRSILEEEHDAEDAFQATFLVFARKAGAGSIWVRGSLGGWFHRVACRIARNAEADRRRRRSREATMPERSAPDGTWADWLPVLHEEIDRLPTPQRGPVVLCDLQELTYEQAARQLRLSVPTVRSRLARGRERLRMRLTRRGMTGAGAALGVLAGCARDLRGGPRRLGPSSRPGGDRGTGRLDLRGRAGRRDGPGDAGRAAEAGGGPRRGLRRAGHRRTARRGERARRGRNEFTASGSPPCPEGRAGTRRGRRDGRGPRPGRRPGSAAARWGDPPAEPLHVPERAAQGGRADRDVGSGRPIRTQGLQGLHRPADQAGPRPSDPPRWIGARLRSGLGGARTGADDLHAVTIRLVKDDVPLEGRVLDLEGRPIAGAVIRTTEFFDPPARDLAPWIAAFKTGPNGPYDGLEEMPLKMRATTGPDGRFRLAGMGRERVVMFTVAGPAVELARGFAMTKDAPPIRAANPHIIAPDTLVYHGARFDYIAAPGREVSGVVRDQDTNAPLAGVKINGMAYNSRSTAFYAEIESVTDDQGRYRLHGLAQSGRYTLFASPGKGMPYPTAQFDESVGLAGPEPATVDLKLKRGILVRGRFTDKATGKPVRGFVQSYSLNKNPHVKDYPTFRGYAPRDDCDADGRFEIAALPGPGFLAARASDDRYYLGGVGAETIPGMNPRMPFSARPGFSSPSSYQVIAAIDAEPGSGPITRNLECDPGRTLSGTVVDPDGKPLSGVWAFGLKPLEGRHPPLESDRFVATALDPKQPRLLYFFHDGRGLAASVSTQVDQPGPIVVKLQPHGVITGRLVDDDGQAAGRLSLINFVKPDFHPKQGAIVRDCRAGDDGRFRLVVVPGLIYEAVAVSDRRRTVGQLFKDVELAAGETRDLGDVTIKKPPGQ